MKVIAPLLFILALGGMVFYMTACSKETAEVPAPVETVEEAIEVAAVEPTPVPVPVIEEAPAETIELEFELPEPFFGGTPLPYWSEYLEEESFTPRPAFKAEAGTTVISKDKSVTSSDMNPVLGELKMLTDGDKAFDKESLIELGEGVQWGQVDLGAESILECILLWHFHADNRVYFDVIVQASNDPEFKTGITTLYNNDYDNSAKLGEGKDFEYIDNDRGRLIDMKDTQARYVRVYGNGNTANNMTNFVELEVWGR